jgi:hypothetical protein
MTTSQKAARLGEELVSSPQFLAVANPCGHLVSGSEYYAVCDAFVATWSCTYCCTFG